jgi:hypothetical protein
VGAVAPGMTNGNGSAGVWHVIKERVPMASATDW